MKFYYVLYACGQYADESHLIGPFTSEEEAQTEVDSYEIDYDEWGHDEVSIICIDAATGAID